MDELTAKAMGMNVNPTKVVKREITHNLPETYGVFLSDVKLLIEVAEKNGIVDGIFSVYGPLDDRRTFLKIESL